MRCFRVRQVPPAIGEVECEFRMLVIDYKSRPLEVQRDIGFGIKTCHAIFVESFKSISDFLNKPKKEQLKYMVKVLRYEDELSESGETMMYIASRLYSGWLWANIEGDQHELVDKCREGLLYFSNQADMSILV